MALNLPKISNLNLPQNNIGFLNDFKNAKDDGASKFGTEYFTNDNMNYNTTRRDEETGEPSKYVVFCRIQIRKAKDTIEIPFQNVLSLEFHESQDKIMYFGKLDIDDPLNVVTDKYSLVGEETIIIAFGLGANRTVLAAKITKIEGLTRNSATQENSQFTIYFSHPMVDIFHNVLPLAFTGNINTIIEEIMQTYSGQYLEKPIIVSTQNRGLYVNPAFSLGKFISYLRDISISTREEGAYSLFITRNRFYFVPKDYFNAKSPYKKITDISVVESSSTDIEKETALQILFNSFNRKWDMAGIHNRGGSAYDFENSRLINYRYDLNSEKDNKNFLGSYIHIGRNLLDSNSNLIYSGFRNESDLQGYIKTKSEEGLEKTSKAIITVTGDINWEPGKVVELEISHYDKDIDKNAYFSGLWVVNSVTHALSFETGYVCFLELYRNSTQSVADQNLLLRV